MPAVVLPLIVAFAMLASLAFDTASFAIVAAKDPVPEPVTSPANVMVWSPVLLPMRPRSFFKVARG